MVIPASVPGGYQLWHYYPSVPGAIVMAMAFLGLSVAHLWFIVKRGKMFYIPLVVGGIFEVVGYAARALAHYSTSSTLPYAIQSLLILLAPILLAACAYMYLGRIILAVEGQKHCLVPARFLTKIFVTGDVICFFIQAGGGGLLAGAKSTTKVKLGEAVILAGLVLQVVIFGLFLVVAGLFHTQMQKDISIRVCDDHPWQQLMMSLYLVSALIAVRNIIRAIEYGMGSNGYLLTHEWTTFLFDGVPMVLVLTICLFWYDSSVGSNRNIRSSGASHNLQSLHKSRTSIV